MPHPNRRPAPSPLHALTVAPGHLAAAGAAPDTLALLPPVVAVGRPGK